MVSFQDYLDDHENIFSLSSTTPTASKKRKWFDATFRSSSLHLHDDQNDNHHGHILDIKLSSPPVSNNTYPNKHTTDKSSANPSMHLQLDQTHFPSDTYHYLSGRQQKHFYNSMFQNNNRTTTSTTDHHQPVPAAPAPNHMMSLDLELNLPCGGSSWAYSDHHMPTAPKKQTMDPILFAARTNITEDDHHTTISTTSKAAQTSRSTLSLFSTTAPAFDNRVVEENPNPNTNPSEEMVATACMRCHMLVILCKSSPTCPNCKFMHPPDHRLPSLLFKPALSGSLSC